MSTTQSFAPKYTRGDPLRWQARRLWFNAFLLFERLGIHIMPKNFYTPVPDFRWLTQNKNSWTHRASLAGIHWNVDEQLEWLRAICAPFYSEVKGLSFYHENASRHWGPGYGPIESQVLHCFLRSMRPRRIIEIGSGLSTVCTVHALHLNAQEGLGVTDITCVDPYASKKLRDTAEVTIIPEPLQMVSRELFSSLEQGDLLFIDSSHAVRVGSDVICLYLDILPRLRGGIYIHIHDINLPYLYSPSTLSPYFSGNSQETVLLTALLTGNQGLSVLTSLSALHYDRKRELKQLIADYEPEPHTEGLSRDIPRTKHLPSSTWLLTH